MDDADRSPEDRFAGGRGAAGDGAAASGAPVMRGARRSRRWLGWTLGGLAVSAAVFVALAVGIMVGLDHLLHARWGAPAGWDVWIDGRRIDLAGLGVDREAAIAIAGVAVALALCVVVPLALVFGFALVAWVMTAVMFAVLLPLLLVVAPLFALAWLGWKAMRPRSAPGP